MNDAKLLERASLAKVILDNPVYVESWEAVREAIVAGIEKTPLSDTQTAERLRVCLKLLKDVRLNLELMFNQGKIVSFKLEQERKRRENPNRNVFHP